MLQRKRPTDTDGSCFSVLPLRQPRHWFRAALGDGDWRERCVHRRCHDPIVRAEGAGEPIPQRTPCGAWDYDGGLLLTDLTPGVELTLLGAASGYARREMSFLPFPMPGSYQAVFITLSKAQ